MRVFIIKTAIFLFFTCVGLSQAVPRELVYNNHFTSEYRDNGWSEYVYANVASISSSVEGSTDGKFIRCNRSLDLPGKLLGNFAGAAQSILPCPLPGTELTLSANVKCEVLGGESPGEVLVEFTDSLGNRDITSMRLQFDVNSFTEKSITATVPADAQWCRVWFRKAAEGDLEVDWVSLTATVDDTPAPVSNLSADEVFAGKVVLSWNAVSHVDGYRIIRKEGSKQITAGHVGPGELTFTDYDVEEGSTYTYEVYAVGSYGLSPVSQLTGVQTTSRTVSPGNTTYYVDASGGDDANNGTSTSSAWKTFEQVNDMQFSAGDQILLKCGETWNEPMLLRGSGITNNLIQVASYGTGNQPVINPLGLPLDVSGRGRSGDHIRSAAIWLRNGSHWEIRDLEVANEHPYFRGSGRMGIEVDNVDRVLTTPMRGIHLENLYVHDVFGAQLRYSQSWIKGIHISGSSRATQIENVRIADCVFERIGVDAVALENVYHSVVENNQFDQIGYSALLLNDAYTGVFQDNVCSNVGVYLTQQDNAVIDSYYMKDWIVQNNLISDSVHFSAQAATLWNAEGVLLQHNYFRNLQGGGLAIQAASSNITSRYNIFENVGSLAPHNEILRLMGSVKDNRFYNNTVYVGAGHDTPLVEGLDDEIGWPSGTEIRNNLFSVDGTSLGIDLGGETGAVVQHNVYYGNCSAPAEETSEVTGNPRLTFPITDLFDFATWSFSGTAYQLPFNSSCVDAGIAVANDGGKDFFGHYATAGSVTDVGATEYNATVNLASRDTIPPYVFSAGVQTNSVLPEDSYVSSSAGNANYGSDTRLRCRGSGTTKEGYLKFHFSSEVEAVSSASLFLYSVSGAGTMDCREAADTNWEEDTLTWNNAPGTSGGIIDSVTTVPGEWCELDISSMIPSNGTYAVVLSTTGSTELALGSTDSGWEPFVEVTYTLASNAPPVFRNDPIPLTPGRENNVYAGTLVGKATDVNFDIISYSKLTGPDWLTIADSGTLSGTPTWADTGLNSWSIEADDGNGGTATATLNIMVQGLQWVFFDDFTSDPNLLWDGLAVIPTERSSDQWLQQIEGEWRSSSEDIMIKGDTTVGFEGRTKAVAIALDASRFLGDGDYRLSYTVQTTAAGSKLDTTVWQAAAGSADYTVRTFGPINAFAYTYDNGGDSSVSNLAQTTVDEVHTTAAVKTLDFTYSGAASGADVVLMFSAMEPAYQTARETCLDNIIVEKLIGYVAWELLYGVELGGQNADFDGDGLSNFSEYTLGGNPTNGVADGNFPTLERNGAGFIYTHPFRTDDSSLVYTPETTTNLVDGIWTNSGIVTVGTNETGETFGFITHNVGTTFEKMFIRLRVE